MAVEPFLMCHGPEVLSMGGLHILAEPVQIGANEWHVCGWLALLIGRRQAGQNRAMHPTDFVRPRVLIQSIMLT
jgi:hypothetical protein